MPSRNLSYTVSQTTDLSASVCIIGAGIAGLLAAMRLAKGGRRVVVLESGLRNGDPTSSTLNAVDNPAQNYVPDSTMRMRALGGTSLLWSGKLIPLSRSDVLPRPYLGLAGWPFDVAELDIYQSELDALMRVDNESFEEDVSDKLDPSSLLARNDADFCLRWSKRPPAKEHNLAYVYRKEIEKVENIEIWLGATVSKFDIDLSSGKVKALTASNHMGKSLRVVADEYLIAAGTLESTRLLLLADRQSNQIISRDCDALGRYFNGHLKLNVATLRPLKRTLTNRALCDRATLGGGRHLHFELRPELQEKMGVCSAFFDVGFEHCEQSSLLKAKQILQDLKRRDLNLKAADIQDVLRDAPSLFWKAQWHVMRKQNYWAPNGLVQIKIWIEQLPLAQNRISLSEQKDALQVPMLKIEWQKTDQDEKTFRMTALKIREYWNRHLAHACDLEWIPEVSNPEARLVDLTERLGHPAGSTRMGTSPSDSIVAPDLRVHRIPNLSVASASVFPTSGSANPTLVIMQLAFRAADAIAKRLSTGA
jgi:choline dehydrogenase-like flavoprotein